MMCVYPQNGLNCLQWVCCRCCNSFSNGTNKKDLEWWYLHTKSLLLLLLYITVTEIRTLYFQTEYLPASTSGFPFHSLVKHELNCRVKHQHQRGQSPIPQSPHSLTGYYLREGIFRRNTALRFFFYSLYYFIF